MGDMESYKVMLNGPAPWGFRLQGGKDFSMPLSISRLTPGGKAAQAGVGVGDWVLYIDGESTSAMTHIEAQNRIRACGDRLCLTLSRAQNHLGKPQKDSLPCSEPPKYNFAPSTALNKTARPFGAGSPPNPRQPPHSPGTPMRDPGKLRLIEDAEDWQPRTGTSQSRSFRKLARLTGTDGLEDHDEELVRKPRDSRGSFSGTVEQRQPLQPVEPPETPACDPGKLWLIEDSEDWQPRTGTSQSRSFRKLAQLTGTDGLEDHNEELVRKPRDSRGSFYGTEEQWQPVEPEEPPETPACDPGKLRLFEDTVDWQPRTGTSQSRSFRKLARLTGTDGLQDDDVFVRKPRDSRGSFSGTVEQRQPVEPPETPACDPGKLRLIEDAEDWQPRTGTSQSRSFRKLARLTGTDGLEDHNEELVRKPRKGWAAGHSTSHGAHSAGTHSWPIHPPTVSSVLPPPRPLPLTVLSVSAEPRWSLRCSTRSVLSYTMGTTSTGPLPCPSYHWGSCPGTGLSPSGVFWCWVSPCVRVSPAGPRALLALGRLSCTTASRTQRVGGVWGHRQSLAVVSGRAGRQRDLVTRQCHGGPRVSFYGTEEQRPPVEPEEPPETPACDPGKLRLFEDAVDWQPRTGTSQSRSFRKLARLTGTDGLQDDDVFVRKPSQVSVLDPSPGAAMKTEPGLAPRTPAATPGPASRPPWAVDPSFAERYAPDKTSTVLSKHSQPATPTPMQNRSSIVQAAQQAPEGLGRTPLCYKCNKVIRGRYLVALGHYYHPEEFTCCQCRKVLDEGGFFEEKGSIFCPKCYDTRYAPSCAKCKKKITGEVMHALKMTWHVQCFTCAACKTPIRNRAFYMEEGQPYCERDYEKMFGTKCRGCDFKIDAGDRFLEALGFSWHDTCFVCAICQTNLEGKTFYSKKDKPLCKSHAFSHV
ncbi:LOW QUALITY PROTEIN: PDZ and LIM domain protein 7 [Aythya fuligula]|uniref:PDZ and LIM domain protein 7 n=7 Tax=Neognathae TaxID=8825 RepID=A0A6J3DQI2_AYTFU|nr:LOW QUALITY PROTEIN: PDZ and LIM domain protein 7 [Aythya fuligula]